MKRRRRRVDRTSRGGSEGGRETRTDFVQRPAEETRVSHLQYKKSTVRVARRITLSIKFIQCKLGFEKEQGIPT